MSRSYRKDYQVHVANSNKAGKRQANKSLRVATRKVLSAATISIVPIRDEEGDVFGYISNIEEYKSMPRLRSVSDVYAFPTDGLAQYKSKKAVRK